MTSKTFRVVVVHNQKPAGSGAIDDQGPGERGSKATMHCLSECVGFASPTAGSLSEASASWPRASIC